MSGSEGVVGYDFDQDPRSYVFVDQEVGQRRDAESRYGGDGESSAALGVEASLPDARRWWPTRAALEVDRANLL